MLVPKLQSERQTHHGGTEIPPQADLPAMLRSVNSQSSFFVLLFNQRPQILYGLGWRIDHSFLNMVTVAENPDVPTIFIGL